MTRSGGVRTCAAFLLVLSWGCFSAGDGRSDAAATDGGSTSGDDGGSTGGDSPPGVCDGGAVAPSPIRRLSRAEYNNTVRDLLGDTTRPADAFVPDSEALGFDNNASVQLVTELLAEQYMAAAESLAEKAVTDLPGLLAGCDPGVDGEQACADAFIEDFGARAYRRPLTPMDRERLQGVYAWGRAERDFATGIQLVIELALQSPHFLYRVEHGMPDGDGDGVVALTDHELAARLSYLIWGSMPDAELFAAAQAGDLQTTDGLAEQAERMLADPKAADMIVDFYRQLLDLDTLEVATKDPEVFGDFDDEIRWLLRDEALAFVRHVLLEDDGRWPTLLGADYTFLNGKLGQFYGIPGVSGEELRKVQLPPSTHRRGVLTLGGLMAGMGKYDTTSPIHRGIFVRDRLLCQPLPPPPDDVDFTPPEVDPDATTREKFEEHTKNPACQGCHALIDPIGFGFEHFDGVGRYRAVENGFPVDARGQIVGSEDANGEFDGVEGLVSLLSESQQVRECVVTQWFRYGQGRGATDEDTCSLEQIRAAFEADASILDLIVALTRTDAFRYRRAGGE